LIVEVGGRKLGDVLRGWREIMGGVEGAGRVGGGVWSWGGGVRWG